MDRDPLRAVLSGGRVAVLDGGLSTELERRDVDLRDPLWTARVLLEDPGVLTAVHTDYLDAGADIVITASYQASFGGFAARGVDHAGAVNLLTDSVRLAAEARDRWWGAGRPDRLRPLVAASVGPYGATLGDGSEYSGAYDRTEAQLRDFHAERLEVLVAAGPDLLAIETIPSIVEARTLVELLDGADVPPSWCTFTCRDERSLRDGTPFVDAVDLMAASTGVVAIGVNCTAPAHVEALVEAAAGLTTLPVVAYPNRGTTWDAASKTWTLAPDERPIEEWVPRWVRAGARILGGCCGFGVEHIRAVADRLRPAAETGPGAG